MFRWVAVILGKVIDSIAVFRCLSAAAIKSVERKSGRITNPDSSGRAGVVLLLQDILAKSLEKAMQKKKLKKEMKVER